MQINRVIPTQPQCTTAQQQYTVDSERVRERERHIHYTHWATETKWLAGWLAED